MKKFKLIYSVGLPSSGKSTFARKMQDEMGSDKLKLVDKDSIREMLDQSVWSKNNEKMVLRVRDFIIEDALSNMVSVFVHDTNFGKQHKQRFIELASKYGAELECCDFTHVDLETCIQRDLNRAKSVGERVIRDMWRKNLAPKKNEIAQYREQDPNKIPCVLVDVDGTVAQMVDRSPYDWSRVGEDKVNEPVADLVRLLYNDRHAINKDIRFSRIIIMSGRDGSCKEETVKWLKDNNIPFDDIFMRAPGDQRKDSVVKEELFYSYIESNYRVKFVLDDRNQVVETWRSLGLPCFQVAEGNF